MRQRIVINLDEPKTAGAKRGGKGLRWRRVLAILAMLVLVGVVVVAAGGFLWWRHYQSMPAYTVALILDAAQRDDLDAFQNRVDDEEIAKNMAAEVSQKAGARFAGNSSMQQVIDNALPSLTPAVKKTIHDELLPVMKSFAAAPEQRSFISLVAAVSSFMTVTTEGDIAKATGRINGHRIELTMRPDANRWKVIKVDDDLIVQRVVDTVMKGLPAMGGDYLMSPLLLKQPQRKRGRRQR
jgi:hypothetical protein